MPENALTDQEQLDKALSGRKIYDEEISRLEKKLGKGTSDDPAARRTKLEKDSAEFDELVADGAMVELHAKDPERFAELARAKRVHAERQLMNKNRGIR